MTTRAKIGRQPDVVRIINRRLRLPFPWVRDSTTDGGRPDIPPASTSPDMVFRARPAPLGGAVLADDLLAVGDDSDIQLRVSNRGKRPALDVELDVYSATPSVGFSWAPWAHRGTATVAVVPAFGTADAVVAFDSIPAVPWNMALLSVLRVDPADAFYTSGTAPIGDDAEWLQRLRAIARRLGGTAPYMPEPDPDVGTDSMSFDFEARGSEAGRELPVFMVIESRLTDSARLFLEVHEDTAHRSFDGWDAHHVRSDGRHVYELKRDAAVRLPAVVVGPGEGVPLRLLVNVDDIEGDERALVSVRQTRAPSPRAIAWTVQSRPTVT